MSSQGLKQEIEVPRLAQVAEHEMQLMRTACALQPRIPGAGGAVFPALPVHAAASATPVRPLRICIVTQDIVGPIRNGGIGTAFRYAAELYAGGGHHVTILYALGDKSEDGSIEHWVAEYAKLGIEFVPMPEPAVACWSGSIGRTMSLAYGVYEWLKQQHYDVVHVSEWRGLAYYCLVAKELGIAFAQTLFCVKTSSPTLWNMEGNAQLVQDARLLITAYMERKSVELADVVISGSAYMLRWMGQHGYQIPPGRAYVQPNIMPAVAPAAPGAQRSINELVFFGRLEARKGLHLFCDALGRLDTADLPPFSVTFLGKHAAKFNSREFIEQNARNWKFQWRIMDEVDQPGALAYLGQEGRLAVMPSIRDNSPFGVYECLSHRIPFITSAIGGGPELVLDADHPEVLFSLQPSDLAARLRKVLAEGMRIARPSYDLHRNNDRWLAWHAALADGGLAVELARARRPALRQGEAPLVSVCIPHHDRPELLKQALASVEAQSYSNLEVIVVDDGSRLPETIAYLAELEPRLAQRGWKLIRQDNRYVAAARNAAARAARGKYLYLLDDDNVAKPHAVATLVDIAERTGTDILSCFGDLFSGSLAPGADMAPEARFTLLGDNIAFGAIANGFGDTHSLVRREAFERLGGYREEYGVGKEDMEFFARAVLRGCSLQHVPEALYWYRRSEVRIRQKHYREHSGDYRVLEAYFEAVPQPLQPLLTLAQGMVHAKSLSGELSALINESLGSTGRPIQPTWEMGQLMATRPGLYELGRTILRWEMNAMSFIVRAQIALASRLLRLAVRVRNVLRGAIAKFKGGA